MKHSILKKMWLSNAAVLSLLVVMGAIGIWSLLNVTGQYKAIIDEDMHRVDLAKSIQNVQKETGTLLLEYIMFGKETAITKLTDKVEERNKLMSDLQAISTDEMSINLLNNLEEQTQLLFESNDTIIELKRAGDDFRPYSAKSAQINEGVLADLEKLIEQQEKQSKEKRNDIEDLQKNMIFIVVILALVSLIVGTFIAFKLGRNIATPIQKVTTGLEEIANGNLLVEPIMIKNNDEIGTMAQMFNRMLLDLQMIVGKVRDSSSQLAASAEELSASSQQSLQSSSIVATLSEEESKLSAEQGEIVDHSARAMQELGSSVHSIAGDNAVMLEATERVYTQIEQGSSVVSNVSMQMNQIHQTFVETTTIMVEMEKHSDEIQQVTTLITGIAEQTNLLALNAAIEAARAGESGKGFAVVADEVRKLAEQSKKSAEEIGNIVRLIQQASTNAVQSITDGGKKVEEGMSKTTESIEVFKEIEESVEDVVAKVQSVAGAIEQVQKMTETVSDNTQNIQSRAQMVIQNTQEVTAATEEQLASTEDIAANAQSLAELAEDLQKEVNHFKI